MRFLLPKVSERKKILPPLEAVPFYTNKTKLCKKGSKKNKKIDLGNSLCSKNFFANFATF